MIEERTLLALALLSSACAASAPASAPPERSAQKSPLVPAAPTELRLEVGGWKVIERESGPVNYYRVSSDGDRPSIAARYRPPDRTTVLGYPLDESARTRARKVRWSWRAITLPDGGDECADGKGDSAAVIYLTWRRGLRYYTLKYVWSAVSPRGAVCDSKRNPFVAQDTVVLESGGPVGTWRNEEVDLRAEFRKHFEDGDPSAEVPGLLGVGIMTDGDQTQSESAADYADFVIALDPE